MRSFSRTITLATLLLLVLSIHQTSANRFTDYVAEKIARFFPSSQNATNYHELPPLACETSLDCVSREYTYCEVDSHLCAPLRQLFHNCTYNDQCLSSYCDLKRSQCRLPNPFQIGKEAVNSTSSEANARCQMPTDCFQSDTYCNVQKQQCLPRKPTNAACQFAFECQNGSYCRGGFCINANQEQEGYDRRTLILFIVGGVLFGLILAVILLIVFGSFCLQAGWFRRPRFFVDREWFMRNRNRVKVQTVASYPSTSTFRLPEKDVTFP